jgi:O-antigen ligase
VEIHKDRLDRLIDLLWGLVLVCLPVTSFPFIPFLSNQTQVRPLSIYPMILLFPLLLFQIRRKRIKIWQPIFTPLAVFILIAIVTTIIASMYAPLDLHGLDFFGRVFRGFLTLIIGVGFFTFSIWIIRDKEQLFISLRWLYLGLFFSFLWGTLQLLVYYGWLLNENIIDQIQKFFSISGVSLKNLRVTGFAFEPSWLAGQISIFYIPWLFASLLTGFRLTRWRWLEFVLIGMATFLLVLTYSRSGLLMVLVACLFTTLFSGRDKIKQSWNWWKQPFIKAINGEGPNKVPALGLRVGVLVMLIVLAGLSLLALGNNPYFSKLWRSKKTNILEYVIDISAGPRLAYAMAGLETFNQHPWTGVGLGADGLYLYSNLPDWSKTFIPEISIQLSPTSISYPNSKNLFVRILSETGILGLGAFIGFLLYILARILTIRNFHDRDANFLVVSGLFSWIVIFLYCFTQDSFAMPNTWINFGMLLGVSEISINSIRIINT